MFMGHRLRRRRRCQTLVGDQRVDLLQGILVAVGGLGWTVLAIEHVAVF